MNKDRIVRIALTAAPWVLCVGAWWTATYFNDPDPAVAVTAMVAWACLLVAIFKFPKPRGPKE